MKAASLEAKENRKRSKPLKERKRRARINNALLQLKTIILQAVHPELVLMSKLEKADLLEMANAYILHLQNSASKSTPRAVSTYSLGFNECASEVLRYMESMEGTSSSATTEDCHGNRETTPNGRQIGANNDSKWRPNGDLHSRLLEHLSSYASTKEMVERCAIERGWTRQNRRNNVSTDKDVNEDELQVAGDSKTMTIDEVSKPKSKQRTAQGRKKLVSIRPKPVEQTCSPNVIVNGVEVKSQATVDPTPLPPIQSFLSGTSSMFHTDQTVSHVLQTPMCSRPPAENENHEQAFNNKLHFDEPSSVALGNYIRTSPSCDKDYVTSVSYPPMVLSESDIEPVGTPPCSKARDSCQNDLVERVAEKIEETPKDTGLPLSRQPLRKRLAARFCAASPNGNEYQKTENSAKKTHSTALSKSKNDQNNSNVIESMDHKTYTVLSNCHDSSVEQMVARTAKALSQTFVSRSLAPTNPDSVPTLLKSHRRHEGDPLTANVSLKNSKSQNIISSSARGSKFDEEDVDHESTHMSWLYADGYGNGFTQNGLYSDQMWRPW